MSAIQANISKGREVEFYERVNSNDPANSALIIGVLTDSGLPSLSDLADYDTIAAMLAGAATEAAVTGYARKTLTDADLPAWSPDDTLNRISLVLPVQTWTPNTGEVWAVGWVAYDPDTTGGTDSALIPITYHEMLVQGTYITTVTGNTVGFDLSSGWIDAV